MGALDWLISSSGQGGSGMNRPNPNQQPIYGPNGEVDSMATARAHLGRTPTAYEQMEYVDPKFLGPNQGVYDGGAGREREARAAGYTGAMPMRYQTGPSFQWGANGAMSSTAPTEDPAMAARQDEHKRLNPHLYQSGGLNPFDWSYTAPPKELSELAQRTNAPAPSPQAPTYSMDRGPMGIAPSVLPNMNNRAGLTQPLQQVAPQQAPQANQNQWSNPAAYEAGTPQRAQAMQQQQGNWILGNSQQRRPQQSPQRPMGNWLMQPNRSMARPMQPRRPRPMKTPTPQAQPMGGSLAQ